MARALVPTLDDEAFARLLQEQRPHLVAQLRRVCGAEAEDVVQETFAKVWRLRGSFDARHDGAGWLVRAAFHTLSDQRARRQRQRDADAAVARNTCTDQADVLADRDEVARCLAELTPLERDLLVGFHGDGLSLRELAERHGMPLNTVKSHLHRARRRLTDREAEDDAR